MYCWVYAMPIDNMDDIDIIYAGCDESEAIKTAKANRAKYGKIVAKSVGVGCIYRYVHQSIKSNN